MPFILSTARSNLCLLVKDLLPQEDFCAAVASINAPKDDLPKIIDRKLYWNLTRGQGYVVIDPATNMVYHIFHLNDKLSDTYLCDPGLAMAVTYDILNFVDAINSQVGIEQLLVDEGPDNNANGFVH